MLIMGDFFHQPLPLDTDPATRYCHPKTPHHHPPRRPHMTIPVDEESWDNLQATLDRPPVTKPRLQALLSEPTPFTEETS